MRDLVNWKDHVVEFPGRYEEKDLGGGLVQHTAYIECYESLAWI